MNRVLNHVRQNVIAYLALFVALGGTSYAAISVPNNSVGAAQIRNHSITPVKFNSKSIAASISAWVILQWKGSHIAATASSSHVVVANSNVGESVTWPLAIVSARTARSPRRRRQTWTRVTPSAT